LLIIRNEENFAEKKTITFNYARVLLLMFFAFFITVGISIYLVTFTLEEWLDPRYSQMRMSRNIIDLTVKIDSLEYEMNLRDQFIGNIGVIMRGDSASLSLLESQTIEQQVPHEVVLRVTRKPIDSLFRVEFENEEINPLTYEGNSTDEFREIYLFTPIDGIVTDKFNPKNDHYGLDLVAKEGEPIKCVADGVVIISSWTLDGGYIIGVQHRANLISMYKHNSELFKNVGSFVNGGDIIAIIGNTGELTSGPHLHFELWHNGNPVNPQEYIAF
jgi:hypothetical protein